MSAPRKPKIVVAQPIHGAITAEASVAFTNMILYGTQQGLLCNIVQNHFGVLSEARNFCVANVLTVPDCTHVLFVDSDIIMPGDAIARLLKHQKPIVSALYFERRPPFAPVFRMERDKPAIQPTKIPDTLFEAPYIGMGFALIETNVCRRILDHFGDTRCFAFENNEGEDIFFGRRCFELGIPTFVDPTVECGHVAEVVIRRHHFENAHLLAPNVTYATVPEAKAA